MFIYYLAAFVVAAAVALIAVNMQLLRKQGKPRVERTEGADSPPVGRSEDASAGARREAAAERPLARPEAASAPAHPTGGAAGSQAAEDAASVPSEEDRAYRSAIRRELGGANKPPAPPENPSYADDTYRSALRSARKGGKPE